MKTKLKISIFVLMLSLPIVLFGCSKHPAPHDEVHAVKYQCSMHPSVVSDKPGNCPICGMRLTKVDTAPAKTQGPAVEGHAGIYISPERQQLIGVTAAPVEKKKLTVTLHTIGHAGYDPDFYNMLQEYKEIISMQRSYERRQLSKIKEEADALLDLIRLKLRLAGLSEDQIRQLIVYGQQSENLVLPADASWVYADIYEQDSLLVNPGQKVLLEATAMPGVSLEGVVRSIDEVLYAMSRTVRVRIEVPNGKDILSPGMTLHVLIKADLEESLAVPEGAVVHTGSKEIAFVDAGNGHIEPREIQAGYEADGFHQIVSGLKEGEKVITSANFLIDSESNMQSALKSFRQAEGHRH